MKSERGFKALLLTGAIISFLIGLWGFLAPSMLESMLGLPIAKKTYGIGRMFGAVMIAIGIGYLLAALQTRSRSLLVQLFAVPAILLVATVSGVARDEIETGQGIVFALYNAAYCLLYFRMYPRIVGRSEAVPPAGQSDNTSTNRAP